MTLKLQKKGKELTRRLLQLDQLLIAEVRAVVYELEAVRCAAMRAVGRFRHAAPLQLGGGGRAAHGAAEECFPHLWHDAGCANHHARYRY